MKNLAKLFGIIAIVAVIGFSMAACDLFESEDDQTGHRYLIVDQPMTWDDAKIYAKDQGGYLAEINNENEQKVVQNLMLSNGDKNFYWLGGYRDGGTWKWLNSSKFEYTNWNPGQPDNHQGKEDKLIIMRIPNPKLSGAQAGKWDDLGADGLITGEPYFDVNNKGLIIEWDK